MAIQKTSLIYVNFLLNLRNILDLKKNCKFYILISVCEMAW